MPRFNLLKQMSASKAVIGLNLLTLWEDARHAASRGSARSRDLLEDRRDPPARRRQRSRSTAPPEAHPAARRATERREGRPHTVIARRPASATNSPSAAATGAHASAAATLTCSTTTPASHEPTALPAT